MIKYLRLFSKKGRIHSEEISTPISGVILREMEHFGYRFPQQLIDRWDTIGKGFGCYRYFLLSENKDIYQLLRESDLG